MSFIPLALGAAAQAAINYVAIFCLTVDLALPVQCPHIDGPEPLAQRLQEVAQPKPSI